MANKIPLQQPCPACGGPLELHGLHCGPCGVELRGPIEVNEFASLSGDDLQLLRVFVLAEGRIRDMEAPLGLSYPTIRNRLGALREKVRGFGRAPLPPSEILEKLDQGELSFQEALTHLKSKGHTK